MYYIYTLSCPIDNEVKYVGCTKNLQTRYNVHVSASSANKRMEPWLIGLKEQGIKPVLGVYSETDDHNEAIKKEIEAYDFYQAGQLLCDDPNRNNYVDSGRRKLLKKYYLSKFFVSMMSARVRKTKTFISLNNRRQKDVLDPFTIMFIAVDLDTFRFKGLGALEACTNIQIDRKRVIKDLLTNNYIE